MKIPSTLRDPELLAQRRAEIVEVATDLFIERGFHKTSIREIARACPFNLAALYMYVSSKADILYLVAQHLVSEITKALEPAGLTTLDAADALTNGFRTYCKVVDRYSRHIRLLYRELESLPKDARAPIMKSVESLADIFENLLARAIEAKKIRKVNTRLAALDLMVAAHMWALHGRLLRSHLNLDEFIEEQSVTLFSGLMEKPIERIKSKAATVLPKTIDRTAKRVAARSNGRARRG